MSFEAKFIYDRMGHRVDTMLGFFFSHPNWDSPTHSPPCECEPPPPPAGEGSGMSQFRRGDKHCGTLGIYVLCCMDYEHYLTELNIYSSWGVTWLAKIF